MSYTVTVKESYWKIRSLYIPKVVINSTGLTPGPVTIKHKDDPSFEVEGTLNVNGLVSGLSKLYYRLNLQVDQQLEFSAQNGTIVIVSPPEAQPSSLQVSPAQSVLDRKQARHVHVDPFRPENLAKWSPKTEADVFVAFGVLQEYTDYEYCCGLSKDVLSKLGLSDASTKPDALLISRGTSEQLVAEFKMRSSDFKVNHKPDEVDVLVCWEDDETNKALLPSKVVVLKDVALTAAQLQLAPEP
jgi:hypothetical protein